MARTFFFYDLETSGVSPRSARIMQFAGQRTDEDLNPIGEPYNILVKLSDDVLPEPDAVMITGITPQKTIQEGVTETEFFQTFIKEVATPDTIFVGFNSIRFDDEFIRFGLYRNFFDAYEWQWKDGRTKWDILDLVRITRALRPEGITWPFTSDGKPTNRLELLSELNGLEHANAHDALSDVQATIDVAKLIKQKQPKLFEYSLSTRDKKLLENFVNTNDMFVYVSGAYASEYEKMTVVTALGAHPKKGGSLVYDLRHDPTEYLNLSVNQLVDKWRYKRDSDEPRLPVKTLQYNRCPAIAPMGVLKGQEERLDIDYEVIQKNLKTLRSVDGFYDKLVKALEIIEKDRQQTALVSDENTVDSELYDGFIGDSDKRLFPEIHQSSPDHLASFATKLKDNRLKSLLPLYKARNFPKSLSIDEREEWEKFRTIRLQKSLPKFAERLQKIASQPDISSEKQYLLEELQLYAESIMPADL